MWKKVLLKLVDWSVPVVVGILIAATWQHWEHSRARFPFTLNDTSAIIPLATGGEFHRYALEFWHDEASPITNVSLKIGKVPAGYSCRIRLEGQQMPSVTATEGHATNSSMLLSALQPQRHVHVELDSSQEITSDNISLSSDQLIGAKYLSWWRLVSLEDLLPSLFSGLLYGTLFYFLLAWLTGSKSLAKLIAAQKEMVSEIQRVVDKEDEIANKVAKERERLEALQTAFQDDVRKLQDAHPQEKGNSREHI